MPEVEPAPVAEAEPTPVTGVKPAGRDPVDAASDCSAPLTGGVVVPTEPVVSVPLGEAVLGAVGTESPVPLDVVDGPASAAVVVPVDVVPGDAALAQGRVWGPEPVAAGEAP